MRAVLVSVSEAELRERRLRGHDRHDEMWEGELHMVPAPFWKHQDMLAELLQFLRGESKRRSSGVVVGGAGVHDPADPIHNFRIPDLSFVARGNEQVIQERGIVGAADAVLEVRSPDDETYEKLPFFAKLGVREVVVIDRDTRRPEVFRLAGKTYLAVAGSPDGWVIAEVWGIRLRRGAEPDRLRIEARDDPTRQVEL